MLHMHVKMGCILAYLLLLLVCMERKLQKDGHKRMGIFLALQLNLDIARIAGFQAKPFIGACL